MDDECRNAYPASASRSTARANGRGSRASPDRTVGISRTSVLRSKRDAVSARASTGKLGPKSVFETGCAFLMSLQPETASHYSAPKWDTVSERPLKRKTRPRIGIQNGTCFPRRLQQRLGPNGLFKAGNRKNIAHQQWSPNQHAVGRQQLKALLIRHSNVQP